MSIRTIISQLRKNKIGMITVAVLAVLFTAIAGMSLEVEQLSPIAQASSSDSGWGRESIVNVQKYMAEISPIANANACGMGASSCFKCHNGIRAKAPNMDAKAGLWHFNHKSVNGDCVGCHKGNERLIKMELAHTGLIKDPRMRVADSCDSCHKSGNSAELNKRYQ